MDTDSKIRDYKSYYDIDLIPINNFDLKSIGHVLPDNEEHIIVDNTNLKDDNPLKTMEGKNIDDIINDIGIYPPTEHGIFGKESNIYIYDKNTTGYELLGKIEINTDDSSRKYNNYLKSFIYYDRCLEYINSLPESTEYDKKKLLSLYTNSDNKKKIINGKQTHGPSIFVLIVWDLISIYTKIESELLKYFKTSNNINLNLKYRYSYPITDETIEKLITERKIPFDTTGVRFANTVANSVPQIFKDKLILKLETIKNDIYRLNKLEITEESSPKVIKERLNLLNKINDEINTIIESINIGNEEIKKEFASHKTYFIDLQSEIKDEISKITSDYKAELDQYNKNSGVIVLETPGYRSVRDRIANIEKEAAKDKPKERLRRASQMINVGTKFTEMLKTLRK